MKKYLLLLVLCCAILGQASYAQDCLGFNMKEGSGFEMNNFDGKGKPMGKIVYKIAKVDQEGSANVFTIDMETFNTKGKSEYKNTYKMKCDGNTLSLDASALISQEQLKSFEKMEMKFTYNNIEYPTKYKVGDKLKDASVNGEGKSGPMPVNFKMNIKNRNVTGQEKITVPAGTFDAYKLTSDMDAEMQMGFPIKVDMQTVSYRAPGVLWDIKSETYRKGKLMTTSELVKIY